MPKILIRKSHNRLKGYDYSWGGYYCATVCAYKRECLVGNIIKDQMVLNDAGEMVDMVLKELPKYYPCVSLDEHTVMPNHVHVMIIINPNK
ncbi:MAG: hypothetical protein ABH844_04545 [Candidatus Omnitrophota bacterium]